MVEIFENTYATQPASSYMLVGVGNIKDIGMSLVDFCDKEHKKSIKL